MDKNTVKSLGYQSEELILNNGFKKVMTDGFSYITGIFYNPETNEMCKETLINGDYDDWTGGSEVLYNMPIDEYALRKFKHHTTGEILPGDEVEVIKGRRVPVGYKGIVSYIANEYDAHEHLVARYCMFEDGQKANVKNCKLLSF